MSDYHKSVKKKFEEMMAEEKPTQEEKEQDEENVNAPENYEFLPEWRGSLLEAKRDLDYFMYLENQRMFTLPQGDACMVLHAAYNKILEEYAFISLYEESHVMYTTDDLEDFTVRTGDDKELEK